MSFSQYSAGLDPLKIKPHVSVATAWSGFAISSTFVIFRLWVRQRTFGKFFCDDYLVIFALACFLATSIIWQLQYKVIYQIYDVAAGKWFPTISWFNKPSIFLRCVAIITILSYTSLWAIKFSFLMHFYRLITRVKYQRFWWWIVMVMTVLGYIACIGDSQWSCLLVGNGFNAERIFKCIDRGKNGTQKTILKVNTAIDVTTLCLVMSVPILLLYNCRLSLAQKIGLSAIFSFSILIIVMAILRVILVTASTGPPDLSWAQLWINLEVSVAIIVSCIASFREFFVGNSRRAASSVHYNSRTPNASLSGTLSSLNFWKSSKQSDDFEYNNIGEPKIKFDVSKTSPQEPFLTIPLNAIRVDRSIHLDIGRREDYISDERPLVR